MSKSFLNKAHGTAAKFGSATVVVELPDLNQLSVPDPVVDSPNGASGRDGRGRFTEGNTASRGPRKRTTKQGGGISDKADPMYRNMMKWAKRYATHRRAELRKMSGGELSAGVCTLLESEARLLAASRFIEYKAGEGVDLDDISKHLKHSAQLANESRQHALAAWELAIREAKARPVRTPHEAMLEAFGAPVEPSKLPPKDSE